MKEYQVYTSQEQPAIQLKPIISYPRTAEAGETYLLTIDVQLAAGSPWPYKEEEFEISFLLETAPFFTHEPLGEHEPGIVLHRFGSTYGAAEYLLKASEREVAAGHIKIALLNGWGLPIAQLKLECEVKRDIPEAAAQKVTIKKARETISISPTPSVRQENILPENDVEQDVIVKQLLQTGWDVQMADHLKQGAAILRVAIPSGNVAIKGYFSFEDDYLLFIDKKIVGMVKTQTQEEQFFYLDEPVPLSAIPQRMIPIQFKSKSEQSLRSVPFIYYTTGYTTEFRNYLEPDTSPRRVYTFHQPATLALWLELAGPRVPASSNTSFRALLRSMPILEQDDLFDYQFEALQRIEQSLAEQHSHTLVQIETGKGKTHLALSSIYRLLTHANAKHILYVVDIPMAKQYALEAFQRLVVTGQYQKFTDQYNVRLIGDEKLDPSVHVYIGMLEDVYDLYAEGWAGERLPIPVRTDDSADAIRSLGDYCADLPIEYFDVIFLAESEYINYPVWHSVLDYFDTFFICIAADISGAVLQFFKDNIVYPAMETEALQFFKNNVVYPAMETNGGSQSKEDSDSFLIRQKQIASVIKSVRDLLRKDSGLSGDTDRLPQLVWLLFLKRLDDFERTQEELLGDDYNPIIEKNYRWHDWVVAESLIHRRKGEELIEFVNDDLIPYLAHLSSMDNRDIRTVIGTIFRGTYNRIRSGYILREIVDNLNNINFNSSDDIHAISLFFETMLKEMRDSAGDAGEFYTPRPIVRFIIDRLQPQLGESILDPACGTAGFLVEAYDRLVDQVQTPEQRKFLQDNLIGIEKKSTPYLLAAMNMLLHGIEVPNIIIHNALTTDIQQLQDDDYVNIIATNPPFGGEEERGVAFNFPGSKNFPGEDNFPGGVRTTETSLLFVQYIIAMLKRPGGRCGIVLSNGFLFGSGVATTRIKQSLLTRFNLHTIVRLPTGAFSPYTNIPTSILFFDACEDLLNSEDDPCTKEVWYYEIPLPEGRKSYTKTKPLQYEDFQDCLMWWDNREENERAWRVGIKQLLDNDYNLGSKNPRSQGSV